MGGANVPRTSFSSPARSEAKPKDKGASSRATIRKRGGSAGKTKDGKPYGLCHKWAKWKVTHGKSDECVTVKGKCLRGFDHGWSERWWKKWAASEYGHDHAAHSKKSKRSMKRKRP